MTPRQSRIFTISPSAPFLEVLARNVLEGFPLDRNDKSPPFTDWTVLLPTRRAAREFTKVFIRLAGRKAILLPKISAIGDLDDEFEIEPPLSDGLSTPISQNGLLLILQGLISNWAHQNPQLELARTINTSASQRLGLGLSLVTLLHQLDTQQIDLSTLPLAYELELSEHREAILDLLALVHLELPRKLEGLNRTTFAKWRNQRLSHEASQLREDRIQKPIIAAGSTGTIPATRELLRAISLHPMGAIVLPGLDQNMDEESWQNLPPEHAQFSMKNMLGEFGVKRSEVETLGLSDSSKAFLISELLRPTQTAEVWSKVLLASHDILERATQGTGLVEARDRHIEARAIALILRNALEMSDNRTAALITPDRDLASRVSNELKRWNIAIDDSAGQPLSRFGLAAACSSLIETVVQDFEAPVILDFLRHTEISVGSENANKDELLRDIELAVLRNTGSGMGLAGFSDAFQRARAAKKKRERSHPLVEKLTDDQWNEMEHFVDDIQKTFAPLQADGLMSFRECLEKFVTVLQKFSARCDMTTAENLAFTETIGQLREESVFSHDTTMRNFLVNLSHVLQTTPFRPSGSSHPRLSIFGTLEARLLPTDTVILGGLNEGIWPAEPDPGPWLNRPMRDILKLTQPEREIGLSAHDFAQGLGHSNVYLTWSKRISGTPKNPSRWILRLKNLFKATGLPETHCEVRSWSQLAEAMDDSAMNPMPKPRPRPAIAARPTRFSVTEIESLLRDPYGIYAKKMLLLEPLEGLGNKSDPRRRGTIFHAAIADWTRQQAQSASPFSLKILQEGGRREMLPLTADPEVSAFWMPAFDRIADWLVENDKQLRENVTRVFAEVDGDISFLVGTVPHVLLARADRIDIFTNGSARIVDYKTGEVPTSDQINAGFSPQLLLEAAILQSGGFKDTPAKTTAELLYIKLSAGRTQGELVPINFKNSSIDEMAMLQLQRLKQHLANYQLLATVYTPRRAPKTEMQVMPYDHLSRFAEWILAEQ